MSEKLSFLFNDVKFFLSGLIGKRCCRQSVGDGRSLSLGFGNKLFHGKKNLVDSYYGEWEVGTYSAAWRISRGSEILCGSNEEVESLVELDELLKEVDLGCVVSFEMLSVFDIRVNLENNCVVDFMGCSAVKDEMFHVFLPDKMYCAYSIFDGWNKGRSDTGTVS